MDLPELVAYPRYRTIANLFRCSPDEIQAIKLAIRHKHDLASLVSLREGVSLKQGTSVGVIWTLYDPAPQLGAWFSMSYIRNTIVPSGKPYGALQNCQPEGMWPVGPPSCRRPGRTSRDQGMTKFYAFVGCFRRRRTSSVPTPATPSRAREAGSGVAVTLSMAKLSLANPFCQTVNQI